jgi:hypothetical protein
MMSKACHAVTVNAIRPISRVECGADARSCASAHFLDLTPFRRRA